MIVLVTGASGGLGSVLVNNLVSRGLSVYGTSRRPQVHAAELGIPMLEMDATDDESVHKCLEQVVAQAGRIDVVINCVNQMFIGSIEETTLQEVESLYQTNVFGVLRICRAIVPIMRKQGGGSIINMSSLGGLLAVPYMSTYTSAKFALESLSEALYREVKKDGISVTIMQPVAMHMDRPASGDHLRLVDNVSADSFSHKMLRGMARDTSQSKLTPKMVSEKIYQVITSNRKPLRVPMDKAKAITWLKRIAPVWLIDLLIRQVQRDMAKA